MLINVTVNQKQAIAVMFDNLKPSHILYLPHLVPMLGYL